MFSKFNKTTMLVQYLEEEWTTKIKHKLIKIKLLKNNDKKNLNSSQRKKTNYITKAKIKMIVYCSSELWKPEVNKIISCKW